MATTAFISNSVAIPVTTTSEDPAVDREVFGELLGAMDYVVIGQQILFEREEQYYLTRIDNERQNYTVVDYQQLPENAPYQLIDGKLEFMASPYDKHQSTLGNLYGIFYIFIRKNKVGKLRFAPLDVHFDKKNVFQPDLLFISNERKEIIQKFIYGAPDLIVEVLSSNKKHDLGKKKNVYGQYNVLEYWAINYKKETLDLYLNKEQVLELNRSYKAEEEVQSTVLKGFSFVLSEIFEEEE